MCSASFRTACSTCPTLYLSRHVLRTRGEYYRLLSRVTSHGEWEPWLLYMLAATEVTSSWTNQKIRAIRALMDATVQYVRTSAPKVYSREFVELIFTQPYCRIANVVERGIAERHRASTYLKELVKLGVLVEERKWRDKIFLHRKYLDVLFSDEHTFAPYPNADTLAAAATAREGRRMTTAPDRLAEVRARIAAAAQTAKRDPASVHLVAVTKTFAPEHIAPVLDTGHRLFGENRVQEAKAKWPGLRERYPGVELHLIGPLQSNKAREAVQLFDVIHTIDRPKIAEVLAGEMAKQGRRLRLFIEVNTGEESQKAGVPPKEAAGLLRLCREELKLDIAGLMCIPPHDEEPAVHFAFLAKLAAELGVADLSMGMSADFETAVAFGATHVRVGSQIFGSRT